MYILALDTSIDACSVAVAQAEDGAVRCLASRFEVLGRGHAERLLPMIKEVMAEAGLSFKQPGRIAVTHGPGTFTGVRIGIASARGLALASKIPVVTASTLHVVALTFLARSRAGKPGPTTVLPRYNGIAVVMDARRGDVYFQRFGIDGNPLDIPQIMAVEQAATYLQQSGKAASQLLVGSGRSLVMKQADGADGAGIVEGADKILPDARYLALAAPSLEVPETPVSPLYLRAADAKPQSGKAIRRK